jgi:hypothetical protein
LYAKDQGLETQADYPYEAVVQTCNFDATKLTKARPTGYTSVIQNNAYELKVAIASGPVSACIEAYSSVFQFYSEGVLNSSKCGIAINHGVAVVGYGVDPK